MIRAALCKSRALLAQLMPPPIPSHVAGRLRVEMVDTLARLGGLIAIVGVVAALILIAAFWSNGPHAYMLTFLVAFLFIYSKAFRRSWAWRHAPKPSSLSVRTVRTRGLHTGIIGILWSTMPIVLTPYADAHQHLMIVYVSSGLVASGVLIAPTLLAALAISVPVTLSTFVSLLRTGEPADLLVSVMTLTYAALILLSVLYLHKSFVIRVLTQFRHEEQGEVIGLLLRDFEESASDWLWQTDAQHRMVHVSERMVQVTGMSEDVLHGSRLREWLPIDAERIPYQEDLGREIGSLFEARAAFRDFVLPVRVGSTERWWSLTGKPAFDRDGVFKGYRGVASDVTVAKQSEARIAFLARYDTLTKLPNRLLFQEVLGQACAGSNPFALLFLDLDDFKAVNDTHGHGVGDDLLVAVSRRLEKCIREGDMVARLAGDEFAILQTGAGAKEASALAQQILDRVRQSYRLDSIDVGVGVSIGITLAPEHDGSPLGLLKKADLALYQAKAESRGTCRFFGAEMEARVQARRALQADLRSAISRNEFTVHFQPIIDLASGVFCSAEALLRWQHPERGSVSPADFIPVAEEAGLIMAIGGWVLAQACREAASWPDHVRVAVNLSPLQFRDVALLESIDTVLRESGLRAERLELEITESVFLESSGSTLAILHQLRSRGVRVALDDFGTGYSSLSYLRSFPFDKVKIDRSFVRDLGQNQDADAIVQAIIGMTVSLGMLTTAEGIETQTQLEILRQIGCSQGQGFLMSRPQPAAQLRRLLTVEPAPAPPHEAMVEDGRLATRKKLASMVVAAG